jgi:hypothetical protein
LVTVDGDRAFAIAAANRPAGVFKLFSTYTVQSKYMVGQYPDDAQVEKWKCKHGAGVPRTRVLDASLTTVLGVSGVSNRPTGDTEAGAVAAAGSGTAAAIERVVRYGRVAAATAAGGVSFTTVFGVAGVLDGAGEATSTVGGAATAIVRVVRRDRLEPTGVGLASVRACWDLGFGSATFIVLTPFVVAALSCLTFNRAHEGGDAVVLAVEVCVGVSVGAGFLNCGGAAFWIVSGSACGAFVTVSGVAGGFATGGVCNGQDGARCQSAGIVKVTE